MQIAVTTAKSTFSTLLEAKNLWTTILGVFTVVGSFFAQAMFDFEVWKEPSVNASSLILAVGLAMALGPFLLKLFAWAYVLIIAIRTGQAVEKLPEGLVVAEPEESKTLPQVEAVVSAPITQNAGVELGEGPVTTLRGPEVK